MGEWEYLSPRDYLMLLFSDFMYLMNFCCKKIHIRLSFSFCFC